MPTLMHIRTLFVTALVTASAFVGDLGAKQKVFVDLACSSHNAMWETNRLLMFDASVEWLTSGTVEGKSSGEIRLGY